MDIQSRKNKQFEIKNLMRKIYINKELKDEIEKISQKIEQNVKKIENRREKVRNLEDQSRRSNS